MRGLSVGAHRYKPTVNSITAYLHKIILFSVSVSEPEEEEVDPKNKSNPKNLLVQKERKNKEMRSGPGEY